MKVKDERYHFDFSNQINSGGKEELNGIAIDVIPKGDGLMVPKKPCLLIQSEERPDHTPFGYIEFVDKENLALAQMGLELLQKAVFDDQELRDSLGKGDKQ